MSPTQLVFLFSCLCRLATSHTTLRFLPGFEGPLPFELETGYIGVDGLYQEDQLFYYFVKSERNSREDPLVVWLTGGPGCSGISGLFYEIGPLKFEVLEYNGSLPTLVLNPHSWTKGSNIIFIDSPVGTGFSFSRGLKGFRTGDIESSIATYKFLWKWFIDHPEFLLNPLYVGGDSYSGITVPILVQEISSGNEAGENPRLNLKGYLLGNAVTDPEVEKNAKVPFAHGMGLLSEELYESTRKNCHGYYLNPRNEQCAKDLGAVDECVAGINTAYILEPQCILVSPRPQGMVRDGRFLKENYTQLQVAPAIPGLECRSYGYLLSYYWANDESVRKALNIQKGTTREWQRCNYDLPYTRDIQRTVEYHLNLTTRGYRALIYNGDHDMIVPFLGTQAWIRSLNFSIVEDWRSWSVHGQIAGYTRTYSNNLTFATVKGGGHTAPEYRPEECSAMFQRWISHNPL